MAGRQPLIIVTALVAIMSGACGRESPVAPSPAAGQPDPPQVAPAPEPPAQAPAEPAEPPSPPAPPPSPPPPAPTAVLAGAGDIGVCGSVGTRDTAALLDTIPGIVFTTGDNAYENGTRQEYLDCYDPWWGRHRSRTRPSPGNHDYKTPEAAGYFEYFGDAAGPPGRGYYSFEAGTWLVLSLNSNVPAGPGSAQLAWLRSELTRGARPCIAAYWHHPLASSGKHGGSAVMRDVWHTLMEFGADVVVAGHDHIYERFAPLDADAFPSGRGIRQFVAGTGGGPLYVIGPPRPGSEARAAAWGVLKLTLRPEAYDWEFVSTSGGAAHDQGSASCG